MRILKDKEIQEVCEKYKTGKWTQKLLAEQYHCNYATIKKVLEKNNIPIITHTKRGNLNLKEDFFENIDSEEKAYFLGLLFTDGNVHQMKKSGLWQISLELSIKDKDILETFKQLLNSNAKTTYRKRENTEMVAFRIYSEKMAQDLSKYGIIPNKTKATKHLPNVPFNLRKHFIRGMIDGDGAIYKSKYKVDKEYYHITFCSYNYSICEELQQICDSFLDEPNKAKILKDNGKEIYRVHYNNQYKVKQLVTVLYKDSNYYLARKYILAKDIFEDKNEEDIV